jgi:sulfate transport system permease protein
MKPHLQEPQWVISLLSGLALFFIFIFLFIPLVFIFISAFGEGVNVFRNAVFQTQNFASLKLSLYVLLWVVPFNTVFGILLAWTVSKYDFKGKALLLTLMDIPFAVSPVIAGMIFITLFGHYGFLGKIFESAGLEIIFSTPGIVLVTLFVTFPYVAKELIPLMKEQGRDEEEASMVLGAKPLYTFFRVTLPNIKWGLMYGMILLAARALGEFGAVSVVSGHIQGLTNTLPLQIEVLYNQYEYSAAFALCSILALVTLFTIFTKSIFRKIFVSEVSSHQNKIG